MHRKDDSMCQINPQFHPIYHIETAWLHLTLYDRFRTIVTDLYDYDMVLKSNCNSIINICKNNCYVILNINISFHGIKSTLPSLPNRSRSALSAMI